MADRRVARTEAAVIGAFERLLDERGYARMTVQEILEAADVGRATFYCFATTPRTSPGRIGIACRRAARGWSSMGGSKGHIAGNTVLEAI